MTAPNKIERQKCWEARDSFWKCLEDNNDEASRCNAQRNRFESDCSTQWGGADHGQQRVVACCCGDKNYADHGKVIKGEARPMQIEISGTIGTYCLGRSLKYFDRRRNYLKFKEKMEKEGYDPLTNTNDSSQS